DWVRNLEGYERTDPAALLAAEAGAPPMRCPRPAETLFLIDKVTAAILLPAAFGFFHAERFFFAVADGLNAIGADSGRNQSALHGRGPLIAQCQVVFGRAAGIAVSLNRKVNVGVLV